MAIYHIINIIINNTRQQTFALVLLHISNSDANNPISESKSPDKFWFFRSRFDISTNQKSRIQRQRFERPTYTFSLFIRLSTSRSNVFRINMATVIGTMQPGTEATNAATDLLLVNVADDFNYFFRSKLSISKDFSS